MMTKTDELLKDLRRDARRWRKLCALLKIAHHGGGVCAENFRIYTSVKSTFKSYRNMRAELFWTDARYEPLDLGMALDAVEFDHPENNDD